MTIALVSDVAAIRTVSLDDHLEIVRSLEDDIVSLREVIAEMAIERILNRTG
jgi:hypothetical protein